ncbi:hypothetical protein [Schumannella sp. 10F1B-5-1]|uniref:hypothetical protein n=1 Tax=Schumannella sp. 10F1B-5-1 TaxID=2590780 RepID=UPI00112FDD81|nr:hypothetical protein [Schumannella sp. 10F1B-5-1]TPW73513.1 hypothetical protein FJ658_04830 [Schumannella sp. 10F1B-5-1]
MTRSAAVLAAVALVAVGLNGCTPSAAGPTVIDDPQIDWTEGGPPAGPRDDDPIVQAARAADEGIALARIHRDFTIAQLTDHVTSQLAADAYQGFLRVADSGKATVAPGPTPMTVLTIESDDDTASVEFCEYRGWPIWSEQEKPSFERTGHVTFSLERSGASSPSSAAWRVTRIARTGQACDIGDPAIGYYVPAVEAPGRLGPGDVRAPIDAD